ncbi:branched-chain amino acid ABC transporter permease [Shinella granuli]|uniref:Amino acid/amide ABC transporter membrane protein 1 (HAAT family) n=1 Tax=Shinella granuli TaxID=323621 RepID=A0A4R2C4I1_SHIGR|nr:branched-chain amino acid ABC transporter permease [Shinella granuli]TCN34683.1 amino acid/amide ABC transporter membrane protein 1 (HAAT family) [Shinella granuli]
MPDIVSLCLNALTLMSILMLVALGLAIIYGLMGIINLSHGEFVTIGAYTLFTVQAAGGSFWLALVVAPVVGYLLGTVLEIAVIRRLYDRPISTILATWGLSLILQQAIILTYGAAPRPVTAPFEASVQVFGITYPAYRLFLIVFAFAVMAACVLVFRKSPFGLDVRAVIQNAGMARALGVNAERVYRRAFASGAALAALAGVLIAPLVAVTALMGVNYLARSFFVVLVGGAGSIPGVIAGSAFVGGLESLLSTTVPITVAQASVLILAVVIVRFRPQGLVPA